MNKRRDSFRHHPGLVLVVVALICAATMVTAPIKPASAQADNRSWSYTGNLNIPRSLHTATLLSDGKILVAGGWNFSPGGPTRDLNSADLYDPQTGTWSVTGNLNTSRIQHTATLLPDGKVLIAGGLDRNSIDGSKLKSVELYDPKTGTWSITGKINTPRTEHTATLLANGKVLVAGGVDERDVTNTVELYDPETGVWRFTGKLNRAIRQHTATLLRNGKVLVVGGFSAELYDPDTEEWSITGRLDGSYRVSHTATLLPDGRVLIVGGWNDNDFDEQVYDTAELYNPDTGTWSSAGRLNIARLGHTATLLPDGKVLVISGETWNSDIFGSELYDPDTQEWSFTSNPNTPRLGHTATLLGDGKVLIAGGSARFPGNGSTLSSAELGHNFAEVPPIARPILRPTVLMASVAGKKLIITGENFAPGAVILINGEEQKTRNDDQNPQTTLVGKKAGKKKKLKPGDRLQVRNPDGITSEEFVFTGS